MKNFIYACLLFLLYSIYAKAGVSDDAGRGGFISVSNGSVANIIKPLATKVNANIAGVAADISVEQIFVMPTGAEAEFYFNAPPNAIVYALNVNIGDRKLEAQSMNLEDAKEEFADYKSDAKQVYTANQEFVNQHKFKIFNLVPGDTIRTVVKYGETLFDGKGYYTFSLPVYSDSKAVQNDDSPAATGAKSPEPINKSNFDLRLNIIAGMNITFIKSPSHKIDVNYTGEQTKKKSCASISIAADDKSSEKDFILNYSLRDTAMQVGLIVNQDQKTDYFSLNIQPPANFTGEVNTPKEYIFMIEKTDSTKDEDFNYSVQTVLNAIDKLNPKDKFNVMYFNRDLSPIFQLSQMASDFIKEIAKNKLVDIRRSYYYSGLPDLFSDTSYTGYTKIIPIFTSGKFSICQSMFEKLRNTVDSSNVFVIGVGANPNTTIIEAMAKSCRTNPIYSNSTGADLLAKEVMEAISKPMLTNVKIMYNKFPADEILPSKNYSLFLNRPITITGVLDGSPKGTISISGDYLGKHTELTVDCKSAAVIDNSQALRYSYIKNEVDDLENYKYENISDKKFNKKIKEKLIKLAEKNNVLTSETAFLLKEKKSISLLDYIPLKQKNKYQFKSEAKNEYSYAVCRKPDIDFGRLKGSINYPERALVEDKESNIVIRLLVDKNGNQKKIFSVKFDIMSDYPTNNMVLYFSDNSESIQELFASSCIAAVKKYGNFEPAVAYGEPIDCWINMPLTFKLYEFFSGAKFEGNKNKYNCMIGTAFNYLKYISMYHSNPPHSFTLDFIYKDHKTLDTAQMYSKLNDTLRPFIKEIFSDYYDLFLPKGNYGLPKNNQDEITVNLNYKSEDNDTLKYNIEKFSAGKYTKDSIVAKPNMELKFKVFVLDSNIQYLNKTCQLKFKYKTDLDYLYIERILTSNMSYPIEYEPDAMLKLFPILKDLDPKQKYYLEFIPE